MFRGGVAANCTSRLHTFWTFASSAETLRFWCFFGKIYEKGDTYWDSFYIVVQE